MWPRRHRQLFPFLLKRMHTVGDYDDFAVDQQPRAVIRTNQEQIIAGLRDLNRSFEPQCEMIFAAGGREIKILGVASCNRLERLELWQLVPFTFVVGILQSSDNIEV